MSFVEYRNQVIKELSTTYGYTKEQVDKFLSKKNIDDTLRTNYARYSEQKFAGCEPKATASCLDMMY